MYYSKLLDVPNIGSRSVGLADSKLPSAAGWLLVKPTKILENENV